MQQNLEGLRVGRHHDELGETSVQRFGRLVGAFPQLLVVHRLLSEVKYLRGEGRVGQRVRLWVYFFGLKQRNDGETGRVRIISSSYRLLDALTILQT